MAITVSHQPDFALLARAGYQIGAGEAMQHYEDQAHQAAMQERALQANSFNQQVAQANALQRMQYGAQLEGVARMEQNAQNELLNKQRLDAETEMRKLQLQQNQDELASTFERQKQMKILDASNQNERDANQFLLAQSTQHMKKIEELRGQGMEFTDGGQKYNAVQNEIAKIVPNETMTAAAKAQAIYELSHSVPIPTVKPQTSQERIQEDVIERMVTMPDGRQVKTLWSVEPDGTIRMHDKIEPEKQQDKAKTGSIADQAMMDLDNHLKLRSQAVKELQARKNADGEPMPFSESEVQARMRDILNKTGEQPGRASLNPRGAPTPAGGKIRMRFENGVWQQI